jgi:hypothetical protein
VKTHFKFTQDCWVIDYGHLILICFQEILEGFERQRIFAYRQRRDKSSRVSGAESHCCQERSEINQSAWQGSRNSRYTCWVERETLTRNSFINCGKFASNPRSVLEYPCYILRCNLVYILTGLCLVASQTYIFPNNQPNERPTGRTTKHLVG